MTGRDLVFAAFRALGSASSRNEVALVAEALRASGDPEVFALFGVTPAASEPPFDHDACHAVAEIAVQAGAHGLTALDVYTEFVRPGWTPFPEAISRSV